MRLYARIEWATQTADMVTQLIALSPITTAGARDQEQSESYNSDDGDEPILHD